MTRHVKRQQVERHPVSSSTTSLMITPYQYSIHRRGCRRQTIVL